MLLPAPQTQQVQRTPQILLELRTLLELPILQVPPELRRALTQQIVLQVLQVPKRLGERPALQVLPALTQQQELLELPAQILLWVLQVRRALTELQEERQALQEQGVLRALQQPDNTNRKSCPPIGDSFFI